MSPDDLMQYVVLPGTDLRVSRFALGTWLFGGRRWGVVDERESVATIEAALDAGITFFDTADAYGDGHAEELLGRAIARRRQAVSVATKVGVVWRRDGTRYVDLSPAHIRRAVRRSLERLRTDVIDLYQLHEMDPVTPIAETGHVLQELQRSGAVRHIGVSNFDVDTLAALREIVPVCTTQSEYSLFHRGIEHDVIPYCAANGISVLAYSPLYRGLLAGRFTERTVFPDSDNRFCDEEFQGSRFAANLDRVRALAVLAGEAAQSVAALAVAWVLSQPSVRCVIGGARTPSQLQENIGAVEVSLPPGLLSRAGDIFPLPSAS